MKDKAKLNSPIAKGQGADPLALKIWILQILAIALAYFVTGKLGALLAIPPGYATAVWPPSGIALAGILICGYRAWPGILLGSLLVNLSIALAYIPAAETLNAWMVTLAMAVGASLQAVLGTFLITRFAGFPNSLVKDRDIYLFLLFGGFLSTLVGSTIGVSALVASGRIPVANFFVNWSTWWLGDAIGVIVFTPLVLVWLLRPSEVWRNRRKAISQSMLLIFALTIAAVTYVAEKEIERFNLHFDQDSNELHRALEKSLQAHVNVLRSLESFYSASNEVNRQEFHVFVAHLLGGFHGVQALEWSPRIFAVNRDTYESSVQKEGYPEFQITERDANKRLVRAGDRPDYVPVNFIEPYRGNEKALGYDMNSDETRQEAIVRARDSGDIAATGRITLVQEHENQYGMLAFIPIYAKVQPLVSVEDRRNNILGYVLAVFRCGDIVTAALQDRYREGLFYRLVDESAPAGERLLFASDQKEPAPVTRQKRGFGEKFSLDSSFSIPMGGRQWRFQVKPTQEYFASHRTDPTWLIQFACLLLTTTVGAFVMAQTGREGILSQLVEERTAALAGSEESLRKLSVAMEQSPTSILITGLDGKLEYVNDAAVQITGYSRHELIGRNPRILKSGKTPKETYTDMWSTLARGEAWKGEFINRRKNGEEYVVSTLISPVRQADGAITHYLAVREDITERRKMEALLRETENRFRVAADAAPVLIWIAGTDKLCTWFNQVWLDFTGRAMEQELGNGWADGVHPDDFQACLATYVKAFDARQPFEMDYRLRRFDGEYCWILDSGKPRYDGIANFLGYIGSCIDITERKRIADELEITRSAAVAANRAKSVFLANMSHEIRTPMNAILGLTHLLQREITEPTQAQRLSQVSVSAKHLLGIINDILDLSKIEADRLSLEDIEFNLYAIIDYVCSIMVEPAQAKYLLLIKEVDPHLISLPLLGDPLRIRQILINYLANAIKFTKQGGITLCALLVDERDETVELRFEVRDTGIGIDQEHQARIFDAFEQAQGSTTREFGGTGLGLSIARKLARMMGGDTGVVSTPGQGSTFWFTARLKRGIALPLETLAEGGTRIRSGAHILLVEDNEINQEVARGLLESVGLVVEVANHGGEALEKMRASAYDLILMDMQMPVMDGLEATRKIREMDTGKSIPILAMTANAFLEDRERCIASGMDGHVSKPVDANYLYATLARWLPEIETAETTDSSAPPEALVPAKAPSASQIDTNVGLKYLGGNLPAYQRMLGKFADQHGGDADKLKAALDAGDCAMAERIAHSLKGLSATLGATLLSQNARTLEQQIHNGASTAELAENIASLGEKLLAVCAEIRSLTTPS